MHRQIEPAILYVGTPVVLVSSCNEDGSFNLAPISSAWFLGWTAWLGFDASSKTPCNIRRTGECVLNLPSADLVDHVDRLALLTGTRSVPLHKRMLGYRHVADKFGAAALNAAPSTTVNAPRVAECGIQLEAVLASERSVAERDPRLAIAAIAMELRVVRVHVEESLLLEGHHDRIDPDKWQPLLMSFRQFYGRGQRLRSSRLAESPESRYAPPGAQLRGAMRGIVNRWLHAEGDAT